MPTQLENRLAAATLSDRELRVLERIVDALQSRLGDDLRAIWLFGSRARGDAILDETDPDRHSDIDLIVIAQGGKARHDATVYDVAYGVALEEGDNPASYSIFVHGPDWLRGRRAIESFFIQEVDRDKIVLAGSAMAEDAAQ